MATALVCREHGLPDKLDLATDWPVPELGPNEVRLRVHAAGLNFPDVLIIQGKYCLLYTSPSPRDISGSRMPSSA